MRKFILASALAATLLPAAAMAQSYGQDHRGDRHFADRQEARGDWRDYRRAHPDIYRGPRYIGPRPDWRYRPVGVGYRFDPVFYDRRYWIDPVRYRLPRPLGWQRWVRYGNDVVLVDTRTGTVVDVQGGFFL